MYRAPVSAIEETLIVPWFSVHILDEDWYHVFISLSIKMMDLVSFVEQIGETVWRWGVDDGGRNDVWHVSKVTIFWNTKLWIRIELSDSRKMNVAAGSLSA